jgi:hypothetical protein
MRKTSTLVAIEAGRQVGEQLLKLTGSGAQKVNEIDPGLLGGRRDARGDESQEDVVEIRTEVGRQLGGLELVRGVAPSDARVVRQETQPKAGVYLCDFAEDQHVAPVLLQERPALPLGFDPCLGSAPHVECWRPLTNEQNVEPAVLTERRLDVSGLAAVRIAIEVSYQDGEVCALGARHLTPPNPPQTRDPPRRRQKLFEGLLRIPAGERAEPEDPCEPHDHLPRGPLGHPRTSCIRNVEGHSAPGIVRLQPRRTDRYASGALRAIEQMKVVAAGN